MAWFVKDLLMSKSLLKSGNFGGWCTNVDGDAASAALFVDISRTK